MKKYIPYLHPILFALYPVIFLYSKNYFEYTESSVFVPLILSLLFGGSVFLITKFLLKDLGKSAIISSFIIFLSLSFGRLLQLTGIKNLNIAGVTFGHRFVFTLILIAFLFLLLKALNKFSKSIISINQYLVILSTILLVFAFIPIINFEAKTGRILKVFNSEQKPSNIQKPTTNNQQPDVYYFIFDRYAGPKSQKEKFGINNSDFFDFLKEKGFYVAQDSTTNYPKTFLSLGSSLNMMYLDDFTVKTKGGKSSDQSLITPIIRNNKIINFLKSKDYYTVNIGPSTWNPSSKNPKADKNYIMTAGTYPFVDAFGTGYLNTTVAEPIFKSLFKDPLDVSEDAENNIHRRLAVFELGAIEEAIKIPGPKYVFTHVLLPHDPFVFDANCNPVSEDEINKHDHVYNYVQQLKCANTKMERIVNLILKESKTPPIIVLQSDEGPFPMINPIPPKQGWGKATDDSLKEKFPILNAYYFPNKNYDQLYPSITPVNSFKVVFNTNFGTDYQLLPDKNFVFKDEENYYDFTDVTERIK